MPEKKPMVVVVEDDDGLRRAIDRLLRGAGFRPVTYASAEELLEAGLGAAACLVVDVRLPGLSGFELSRRLAKSGPRPPLIFITAHDDPSVRAQAERLGAVAYLPKPFPGKVLVDAIAGALRS